MLAIDNSPIDLTPDSDDTAFTWTVQASQSSDIELLDDSEMVQFLTPRRYSWYMDANRTVLSGTDVNLGLFVQNQMSNPVMDSINDSIDQTADCYTTQDSRVVPWALRQVSFVWGISRCGRSMAAKRRLGRPGLGLAPSCWSGEKPEQNAG